ncbi:MAG: hypothetical protein WBM38_01455 [Arenicellales bacterium]
MRKIIAAIFLSLLIGSVYGQHIENPQRMSVEQRAYVAEPAARLARCGRMAFATHLIDVYVDRFSLHLAIAPDTLRESLYKMSYEQYEVLLLANWPDPRTAAIECAAHTRLALELIARWNLL